MANEEQIVDAVKEVVNPNLTAEVKNLLNLFQAVSPALEKAAQIVGIKKDHVDNLLSSIEKVNGLL
jgi:hypothetical protein